MTHDKDNSNDKPEGRLADAVRKARIASADRSDVVVEMRDAARIRLELLAQDLQPVIEDVPVDDERFDFALSSGLEPRLWIDATAHVVMGKDRRTYRFVRDTLLGRVLLAESSDRGQISDRVVSYIAMRIHERELAMAGDTVLLREQATGRSIDFDGGADAKRRRAEARERIDRALASLRGEDFEEPETPAPKAAETPAAAPVAASAPTATLAHTQAAPRRTNDYAAAILSALLWVLLGAVLTGGTLLLVFRDLLLQR